MTQTNYIGIASGRISEKAFKNVVPNETPRHIVTNGPDRNGRIVTLSHSLENLHFPGDTVIEIEDDVGSLTLKNVYADRLSIQWRKTPSPDAPYDPTDYSNSFKTDGGAIKELFVVNARNCNLLSNSFVKAVTATKCTHVHFNQTQYLEQASIHNARFVDLYSNPNLENLLIRDIDMLQGFQAHGNPKMKSSNENIQLLALQYDEDLLNGQHKIVISNGSRHVYEKFYGTSEEILAQMHEKIDLTRQEYKHGQGLHPGGHECEYNAMINTLTLPASRKIAVTPSREPSEADVRALSSLMYER